MSRISKFGAVRSILTAEEAGQKCLELIVDADGFGDVRAIDLAYDTGNLSGGESHGALLVMIDETSSTGGDITGFEVLGTNEGSAMVCALRVGATVVPISHFSGDFEDADSILVEGADKLTELSDGGAGNVDAFDIVTDDMTIGNAEKFEQIEAVLDTGASGAGIKPVFEFSTGVGTWDVFVPVDGTSAFRMTGVIIWSDLDVPLWAVGTGNEFLIRITRTRNVLSVTPIIDQLQTSIINEFFWNEKADLKCNSLVVNGDITSAPSGGGTLAGTNVTAVTTGGPVYKTVFTFTAHPLSVTDSGANGGHGTTEFFTFPEGYIKSAGSTSSLTIFTAQGSNADSGVYEIAVGSEPIDTGSEVLSAGEQNITNKMAGTLVSGALSATETIVNTVDMSVDGTTTPVTLNLNVAITAATISGNEIFDMTGTMTLFWQNLGDY